MCVFSYVHISRFMFLWPSPWPDDLDIQTWPRYCEDVKFLGQVFPQLERSKQKRQTDTHTDVTEHSTTVHSPVLASIYYWPTAVKIHTNTPRYWWQNNHRPQWTDAVSCRQCKHVADDATAHQLRVSDTSSSLRADTISCHDTCSSAGVRLLRTLRPPSASEPSSLPIHQDARHAQVPPTARPQLHCVHSQLHCIDRIHLYWWCYLYRWNSAIP